MADILLVEDDPKISSHLSKLFQHEGWGTVTVSSVAELNEILLSQRQECSLIVLDRLLHRFDTKNMVSNIRARWPAAPILVLSAINSPLDRAELLNLGVDDYLGKPFLNQEMVARVKALTRRVKFADESHRVIGNAVLSFDRFSVRVDGGKEFVLPQKEFQILKHLTRDPGKVLSREDLLLLVWGEDADDSSNVVEATINSLRRRLSSHGVSFQVRNLRQTGYFVED